VSSTPLKAVGGKKKKMTRQELAVLHKKEEKEAEEALQKRAEESAVATVAAAALLTLQEEEERIRMGEITAIWDEIVQELQKREVKQALLFYRARSTESGKWERSELATLQELEILESRILAATAQRTDAMQRHDAKATAEAQALLRTLVYQARKFEHVLTPVIHQIDLRANVAREVSNTQIGEQRGDLMMWHTQYQTCVHTLASTARFNPELWDEQIETGKMYREMVNILLLASDINIFVCAQDHWVTGNTCPASDLCIAHEQDYWENHDSSITPCWEQGVILVKDEEEDHEEGKNLDEEEDHEEGKFWRRQSGCRESGATARIAALGKLVTDERRLSHLTSASSSRRSSSLLNSSQSSIQIQSPSRQRAIAAQERLKLQLGREWDEQEARDKLDREERELKTSWLIADHTHYAHPNHFHYRPSQNHHAVSRPLQDYVCEQREKMIARWVGNERKRSNDDISSYEATRN